MNNDTRETETTNSNEEIKRNYESISSKIYEVRGVKVMLDFELAELYGYETKYFNRQVNNNIEKFDETFMFQLSQNEWYRILRCKFFTANLDGELSALDNLKSKFSTSSLLKQKDEDLVLRPKKSTANSTNEDEAENDLRSKFLTAKLAKRRTLPYAFTEEGIYMLMTILKGELATKQSIMLIKTFKLMKDFIVENSNLLTYSEALSLSTIVKHHDKQINTLERQFEEITNKLNDDKTPNHYLILDGQRLEADVAYQTIYKLAKHTIFVIDDYIDVKTLQLLKCVDNKIKISIFTDNKSKNSLTNEFINDFRLDSARDLKLRKNNGRFHDRYIVIDFGYNNQRLYHSGGSSKDAGNGITTIDSIKDIQAYRNLIKAILTHDEIFI